MASRLREPFGKAGLIVAIVALVAALVGGAYAASNDGGASASVKRHSKKKAAGLNGKQKKEVKNIAKGFQGTGPAGPQGPAGSNGNDGSNGSNGSNGQDGAKGDQGEKGAKGDQGIQGIQGEKGDQGDPGVDGETGFTATLPPGETETGGYAGLGNEEGEVVVALSFPIPLSGDLEPSNVHIAPNAACPGTAGNPEADAGHLCIYPVAGEASSFIVKVGEASAGASAAGAVVTALTFPGFGVRGSFAVTAPEP